MRGLALVDAPARIIDACREKGVLVISAGDNVLRIAPPLVISPEEVDHVLHHLEGSPEPHADELSAQS